MRFVLGVIVGMGLLLGGAYVHDIGMVKVGPPQPFVNWNVVIGLIGR